MSIYKVNHNNKKIYDWEHNDSDIKRVEHNDDTVFQKSIVDSGSTKNFLYRWWDVYGNVTTYYDEQGYGIVTPAQHNNTDMVALEFGDQAQYMGECFNGCTSLSSITIPSNIISLGGECFSGCTGVKELNLGFGWNGYGWNTNPTTHKPYRQDGLRHQTYHNFNHMAIKYLSIPSTMEIVEGDFDAMTQMEQLTINDGVKYIVGSFHSAYALKWLILPPSVIELSGFSAFGGKSIHIPNGELKEMGGVVTFNNCPNLTMLGCESMKFETLHVSFIGCPKLKEVYFAHMFTMEDGCFQDCDSLEYFKFPSSIKWVGNNVFKNCDNIKTIDFGESIEHIGNYLAYSSTKDDEVWEKVIIRNTTPPQWLGRPTILTNKTIYVPDSALTTYQEQWTDVATIIKPLSEYSE